MALRLRAMEMFLMGDISCTNVKEHATLSARESVDHGVGVEVTKENVNRAADRGCVSRLVRFLVLVGSAPSSVCVRQHEA
jgi:uncharacterized OsmC-like protein